MSSYKPQCGDCCDDKRQLHFTANGFQLAMCMIIVRDMIHIFWFMMKVDCNVTLIYPSPVFDWVHCRCGCDTLTWVSSHSNKYPWDSKLPIEASSRFIQRFVPWPLLEYCQHSPETCSVLHLLKDIVSWETTWGSLSTIFTNIDEWWAMTWRGFTTFRLQLIWAIKVWIQSVSLHGHRWASQLMIFP